MFRYIDNISEFVQYSAMASTSQGISTLARRTAGDESDPAFATTLAHGLDVLAAFRNGPGAQSNADLAAFTGLWWDLGAGGTPAPRG